MRRCGQGIGCRQRTTLSRCEGGQEVGPPFFLLDIGVTFEQETVDSILAAKVALVELTVVVVGDLITNLEEGRKEGVLVVAIDHNRRLDSNEGYVRDGDKLCGGVVKLNEVRFGLVGLCRDNRDVLNCA